MGLCNEANGLRLREILIVRLVKQLGWTLVGRRGLRRRSRCRDGAGDGCRVLGLPRGVRTDGDAIRVVTWFRFLCARTDTWLVTVTGRWRAGVVGRRFLATEMTSRLKPERCERSRYEVGRTGITRESSHWGFGRVRWDCVCTRHSSRGIGSCLEKKKTKETALDRIF